MNTVLHTVKEHVRRLVAPAEVKRFADRGLFSTTQCNNQYNITILFIEF